MNFTILYEDDDIVAIDKPSGVMTHPDSHTKDGTVSDWFAQNYPASRDVGELQRLPDGSEIARPGVVHRLDRDTSGVLVLTKTGDAHAHFKYSFQEHLVKKIYLAFVYGVVKEPKGIINFAIGRSRKDFRLRSAQPKAKGQMREALTRYEVLGDIGTHSLLKVMPETGRTHQIRVHLKAIHHPVVCDPLYAPNHPCDLSFKRLGLHAQSLEVRLLSGKLIKITAPIPKDFEQVLRKFLEEVN
jgi:23S rRNA pseudouridine1911/1915/1917 synthase